MQSKDVKQKDYHQKTLVKQVLSSSNDTLADGAFNRSNL